MVISYDHEAVRSRRVLRWGGLGRNDELHLDVSQAFPKRQLNERETVELVQARERLDLALTVVAIHPIASR